MQTSTGIQGLLSYACTHPSLLGSHLPSVPVTHGCSLSPEAQPSPCPNPFFHQTNEVWTRLLIQSDRLAVSCRGICSCQKN